jgi:hypothetical protein
MPVIFYICTGMYQFESKSYKNLEIHILANFLTEAWGEFHNVKLDLAGSPLNCVGFTVWDMSLFITIDIKEKKFWGFTAYLEFTISLFILLLFPTPVYYHISSFPFHPTHGNACIEFQCILFA